MLCKRNWAVSQVKCEDPTLGERCPPFGGWGAQKMGEGILKKKFPALRTSQFCPLKYKQLLHGATR